MVEDAFRLVEDDLLERLAESQSLIAETLICDDDAIIPRPAQRSLRRRCEGAE